MDVEDVDDDLVDALESRNELLRQRDEGRFRKLFLTHREVEPEWKQDGEERELMSNRFSSMPKTKDRL